jgi:hypothetical protein
MTVPDSPPPNPPGSSPRDGSDPPSPALVDYLRANRGWVTDEALAEAARRAGHTSEAIAQAMAQIRAADISVPARTRARAVVVVAYLLTYGVLVVAMFSAARTSYIDAAGLGTFFLSITLGIALLISLVLVGRSRAGGTNMVLAVTSIVVLPMIMLVVIAGLCVGTGLPVTTGAAT